MMQTRKWFLISLSLFLGIFLLAACSTASDEPTGTTDPATQPEEVPGEQDGSSQEGTVEREEPSAETVKVELYFADQDLMEMYRVEKEITVPAGAEEFELRLAKAALEAWIVGPEHEELVSLLPTDVVIQSVEVKDGIAYVDFSKEIEQANLGSTGEAFIIDQLVMIMKQFGFEEVQILVEGEIHETLLGHVSTDQPLSSTQKAEDFPLK